MEIKKKEQQDLHLKRSFDWLKNSHFGDKFQKTINRNLQKKRITEKRIVDEEIILVPYYPNYEVALEWYQNPELCKQVDNIDYVYSLDRLKAMYKYLSAHGNCYYIEYNNRLVGDISLHDGEISIVVCKEFQNRHIGRRCVQNIIELAREKGLSQVKAEIYSFNKQSQKMFLSIGFEHFENDWYIFNLQKA